MHKHVKLNASNAHSVHLIQACAEIRSNTVSRFHNVEIQVPTFAEDFR